MTIYTNLSKREMLKMKTKISRYAWGPTLFLLTFLFACSPPPQAPDERESATQREEIKGGPMDTSASMASSAPTSQLPARFQTPSYTVGDRKEIGDVLGTEEEFTVKVGADISSTSGPVVLRDIMKKLVALKGMNVSWASDVDQYVTVDVDIRADDDFFKAIDQLLRQRDYSHEIQGNTIVVKYKETRKFHLAMPFTTLKYTSDVGGDLLGSTRKDTASDIYGSMRLTSGLTGDGQTIDIWNEVKLNLDKILNIWSKRTSAEQTGSIEGDKTGKTANAAAATAAPEAGAASASEMVSVFKQNEAGLGFYTIDKPVGLITVTAPRYQLEKIGEYLDNLKKELYRQISIEAKIIEVTVTGEEKLGIDWQDLLSNSLIDVNMNFGSSTFHQPLGPQGSRSFTISAKSFNILVDAIKKQGDTRILANPKISVMNGQPAMISVGQNTTYIDSVESEISENIITWTVTTGRVMSGLALSVIANMMENDEVVLQLTPVTSQLQELTYQDFGSGNKVGLPVVDVREMTTIVRVKNDEMLVIGGLVDQSNENENQKIPFLGQIPIIKNFFTHDSKIKTHKELIVLLKPQVIS